MGRSYEKDRLAPKQERYKPLSLDFLGKGYAGQRIQQSQMCFQIKVSRKREGGIDGYYYERKCATMRGLLIRNRRSRGQSGDLNDR